MILHCKFKEAQMKRLHAVIGVWAKEDKTFYVKRSETMENYPGVWSLFSIQFQASLLPAIPSTKDVGGLFNKMSSERLQGSDLEVKKYLTSSQCKKNPINKHVFLHMYELHFRNTPVLNRKYYSDGIWMTREEYLEESKDMKCGLCVRMWADHLSKNRKIVVS